MGISIFLYFKGEETEAHVLKYVSTQTNTANTMQWLF